METIEQKFKIGDRVTLKTNEYEMLINKVSETTKTMTFTEAAENPSDRYNTSSKFFTGYYECVWNDETGVHYLDIHQDNLRAAITRPKKTHTWM